MVMFHSFIILFNNYIRMSRPIALLRQGVICAAAYLFLTAPLLVLAETQEFPDQTTIFPVFKGKSIKTNLVFLNSDDTPMTWPYTIARGATFSIKWNADGERADSPGERTSQGIFCRNSWNTSTAAAGTATGFIPAARDFRMTCAGLGAGVANLSPVTIGITDLIIPSVSLEGLPPLAGAPSDGATYLGITSGQNNNFTLKAVVKNNGTTPAPAFDVGYYASRDPQVPLSGPTPASRLKDSISGSSVIRVNGLAGGATAYVADLHLSVAAGATSVSASLPLYFKVCADPTNIIAETKKDNNCTIIGPYKLVNIPQ